MLKAIMIDIPVEKLGDYKDYIDYLFVGENGRFSILKTEEDVEKANKWFKCFPKEVYIVSTDQASIPGDKILGIATNQELHNRIFTYLGPTKGGVDICDFRDDKGEIMMSTNSFLKESWKFVRMATMIDKEKIVVQQSLSVDYNENV